MTQEVRETIGEMISLLWARSFEDYLSSSAFIRFLLDHELCDEWRKYLELGRDNPALYGSSVWNYAFTRFLEHLHHHLPERFLFLFSRLLADFSRGISCDLPVDEIRSALLRLGYPAQKIDTALIVLKKTQVPDPGR
ncbi:hypothetical protein [Methanoregula formicica]|uniref:Uncharacterized protein n=1 Tax=Methanoregula formicica (strain DSM 22288 / NBRC 105244 / SMSP) TaxID=593750 RepID=L0HKD0_METFS|nr:hypothetical protein [Methanoregula formicica]AGB03778.1 hypothetical protein Metfor_2795 [Methanoregula formicica SMSP]